MAVLLTEDFSNNADGAPGAADTGQVWTLTGAPELGLMHVQSGKLTLTPAGVNGYAQVILDGVTTNVAATFQFSGEDSLVCIMSHREDVFVGLRVGFHIVITNTMIDVQLRDSLTPAGEEQFISIMPGGVPHVFAAPMPLNYTLGLIVNVVGDTVNIQAPDGEGFACTHPRVSELVGHKLVVQTKRESIEAGYGKWMTISVSGDLGIPPALPELEFPPDNPHTPELSMTYATVDDVQARMTRVLSSAERDLAGVLLEDIEMIIRSRVPDLDERIESGDLDVGVVIYIEASAVKRVLMNAEGFLQETDGNYSYTRDSAVASGLLSLSVSDWALLGVKGGMFTIQPVGDEWNYAYGPFGSANAQWFGYPSTQWLLWVE